MVNDAFLFCVFVFNDDAFDLMMMRSYLNLMMRFILKLYSTPPFPSFLMIFIHFFQTLKFLSNPKNFKQTLSIACL